MSTLSIKTTWLRAATDCSDELDATFARLQMVLGKFNITEHKAVRAKKAEQAIEIPVYYLAEWIAENWWVLLFEPRKDEDSDESEYRARHNILVAQHGFPLPDLLIAPFGQAVHLNSRPRLAPFADVKFLTSAVADASRNEVRRILFKFVDDVVDRLASCGASHTALAHAWHDLKSLTPEEREFCELVGSLGVPPNDASRELSEAIEHIYDVFGSRATRDFCLAATKERVERSVGPITAVNQYLDGVGAATSQQLLELAPPPENYNAPSWRRGMQAARKVRDVFRIDTKDVSGADKFFDRLGIDTVRGVDWNDGTTELPFNGAVDRSDNTLKFALLQPDLQHRRFSGIRAAYLAWVSETRSRRLVTNALTRDQQASRSFAAEILIPQSYLRSLAGPKAELNDDQVRKAAILRRVAPDVVSKQASNAGIRVRPS